MGRSSVTSPFRNLVTKSGTALALTLDEFALWLRLADVYWSPEGIESLKAGAFAAACLGLYAFGLPAWRAIIRDLLPHRHAPKT